MKMALFLDAAPYSLADTEDLMMEPVSSSETSGNIHQSAWRNIPEDSHVLVDVGLLGCR
jgi:hypothetical protein